MRDQVDFYDPAYGNFAATVSKDIRIETYGEDIGQNSWLTADEFRRCFQLLSLTSNSKVLEVASGSGGPAIFLASTIGCHVTGVDINATGVANANKMAEAQGLKTVAQFHHIDASQPLPFPADSFDALLCIDAINHLRNRGDVLKDWHRVLKRGGRVLFTDPIIITGILSNEEMSIRSSIGFFLFVPPGENERLLRETGFALLVCEDVTQNTALVSKRWYNARQKRAGELLQIEGQKTFEGVQRFLDVVHTLSSELRLSRFLFVAQKS